MSRCNESYFQTLLCIVFMLIYQNLCGELYLAVFPEFRFFPEIRKSGSFRFFGRFFIRPRPLVRFPDLKKMLANSRVFHPRKLQTALCKPRENRLCPLRLPNLTISAALISTDQHWSLVVQYDVKTDSARMVCYSWLELRPWPDLGWGHHPTIVRFMGSFGILVDLH